MAKKAYTFHIDQEDIPKIKEQADKNGVSVSGWLRMTIKRALR